MFICWLWQQDGAVWAFSALSLLSLSCRQVGAVALLMTDGRRGMKGLMRGAVPLSPRLPLATSMRLPSLSCARLRGGDSPHADERSELLESASFNATLL